MKYLLLLLLGITINHSNAQRQIGKTPTYHFRGGWIFTGTNFKKMDIYTADGYIQFSKPADIDSVIDVTGKYLIPPFGEAHNHNITGDAQDDIAKQYIKDGIYYVKNPSNLPRWRPQNGRVKMIGTVDAIFSNGGLTCTGGHPNGLANRNIGLGIFKEGDGDGGFLWVIDSKKDLDNKWDVILSGRPDFIKTFLLYSEEYEKRKADTKYFNRKGLNPELLKEIVVRAHHRGLRVSTHVETAVDFRNAIDANVDEINHLPGFRNIDTVSLNRFRITKNDAERIAKKGITVVTTLMGNQGSDSLKSLHVDNLNFLKGAHAKIAIGSDAYRKNSKTEAEYLHSLNVFTNLELLKMWTEVTAEAIFQERKIGKLESTYESNFLALDGNPIDDFANCQKIYLRVKQGFIMPDPTVKTPSEIIEAKIDEVVLPLVTSNNYSGTIAVTRNDKTIFIKAYGKMNREYQLNNNIDTKFMTASVSMIFTSAAVMKLVEKGLISITDPLAKFLPDYPGGKEITIHHLLAQRSGIAPIGNSGLINYDSIVKFGNSINQLISYFKTEPLLYKPGARYNHGRSDYILLAAIIEKTSGKSFGDFLKAEIFTTLSMSNTGHYTGQAIVVPNLAKGYAAKDQSDIESAPLIDWSSKIGHASIYSTSADLLKFANAAAKGDLLSRESWEKIFTDYGGAGYGWFIREHLGKKQFQMNGLSPGFSSYISFYPTEKVAVSVLSNEYVPLAGEIGKAVAAIVFNEVDERIILSKEKIKTPILQNLVGTYKFGADFYRPNMDMNVSIKSDQLDTSWGTLLPRESSGGDANKFVLRPLWSKVEFIKDANGKVTAMLLDGHQGLKSK